ncbi:Eco57I restriction-modification methylase domain-containing protein [Candidatus Aciduliprofundum boonei]|uniref:site-specific DNA-methyltransferase (adenine-specific) n=1 Tax=Aciduliprofundum boonei (strain DSM 19572 / T469) TaxID=439481 RepID=B5ICQ9_ACIB4|nr:TaqI-like C-terminal specificity domain-containing protein [Candidatus Aciduliprofundum boonei]ADD09141.1 protein of unknown function DUF450 [Aciduliprofundum boonei T469]EDY36009.1 Type I restriction enzyme R protein N terminal domain protein [Aciduliprofundum boonei T469]HII55393.1 N-6 DNA methylase [Candidatus Aciduliprofundum boonei]
MPAPEIIKELVERFERNLKAYKSPAYKEDQLRQEFINPFFEALGWDMENRSGAAPQYRDVVHEDSIKVAKGTKAPDYAFTLAGRKMFFVEAKKPAVNINKDSEPAYQLRRYAWSAGLPLSILTNFAEFAVYEARKKPKKDDKPSTERIMYLTYKDYVEKWDEIYAIFSKEAVLKGEFDRFAEESRNKRGTTPVDEEFLKEIEGWRVELARNIALRNPNLSVKELNYAVQRTIDRIIFLRMCEDRGVERYGRLLEAAEEDVYAALLKLYQEADEKYNSGLFHFKPEKGRATEPDDITPNIKIDSKVLKRIIKGLYYPESPYEFSVISPEILGQVYEQFLGKVIRLTKGHRAKVEEKPEVKKAGGVYYTPQYIVNYIVENTVGKLCKGKTPKEMEKIKILDSACGSGSFLLGAYTRLLEEHLRYYTSAKNKKRYRDRIYQDKNGEWHLTIREKKRILLNSIYGVDIDEQAVEVTKLSLLLKVLEGENKDALERQQKLWRERALPDLGNNIKCGNSLVGTDYYASGVQMTLFDEERERINAFDWEKEFPEVMKNGGFDVIIGNPPYVRQEMLGKLKNYFKEHYEVYHGTADLYVYFIERSMKLLKPNGIYGIIVANKWMRANYGKPLREWLKKWQIVEILDFGDLPVFKKATTYPCIMIVKASKPRKYFWAVNLKTLEPARLKEIARKERFKVYYSNLDDSGWALVSQEEAKLLEKLKNAGIPLGEYVQGKIYYGIKTGLNEAFVIDGETRDRLIREDPKSAELIKPFLVGKDIKRYRIEFRDRYLILIPSGWTNEHKKGRSAWEWFSSEYPAIAKHLAQFEEKAKKRWDKGEYWWELRPCDYYEEFEKPKIMFPDIALRMQATYDDKAFYCVNTAYIIPVGDKYLLGILNSKMVHFYYANITSTIRGGYMRFIRQYLEMIPIRVLDLSKPEERRMHDEIVNYVGRMLELHRELGEARLPGEKERIKRQIDGIDRAIDSLVYRIYGLTDEEIRIVEGR